MLNYLRPEIGAAALTAEGGPLRGKPSKRRVALLGTGYIADWHAKALASVDNTSLAAVCDQIPARAAAFAARFGVPAVYTSVEAMLAAERLDAVHVLVPPDRHFEACKKVLEAGVSALLEKPMCDRSGDCAELVRLARVRNLRLGVGHNFLFSACYEQLRRDLHGGVIGRLDHLSITWHRELPQLAGGPSDLWMLRDPRNIMLEIGPHCVAPVLDLVGFPENIEARASNPLELPGGSRFYRRWQVSAFSRGAAIDLRFSFVPGFDEFTIHVRGSMASAIVDFGRDTYTLLRNHPLSDDFNRYAIASRQARGLRHQARRTLGNYLLGKLHLRARGNPYGTSIARAMDAFYDPSSATLDSRICGETGAEVIRLCEAIGRSAIGHAPAAPLPKTTVAVPAPISPRILILGATGFIGQELLRQLTGAGQEVRILVRNPGKLPSHLLTTKVEVQRGDLASDDDLRTALAGIDRVFHLARAQVKTWPDYQSAEIGVTRRVGELALAAGVKRFVYTGTIDSYYAGGRAGTITETTPLDLRLVRRNLYARAKGASEEILLQMHRGQGLPLVIVRPGIVVGRGGTPFHWGIGMWWHNTICQMWGAGNNKLPLVLVQDVAKGLIAASATPGIEGDSFNLVGEPCLSAREYLGELDRCGGFRLDRRATSIWKFYLTDLFKWSAKVLVRHPDRRLPSYRDWDSRRQCATFDCSRARTVLEWEPASGRSAMIQKGIEEPLREALH